MSNQRLILFNPKSVKTTNTARLLGRQLIEEGHITTTDLVHALEQQSKMDAQLGDILVANGALSSQTLLETLAMQSNAQHVDLNNDPCHASLSNILSAQICLKHQVVAWLRMGNSVLVARSHPDKFDVLRAEMKEAPFTFLPVIADPRQIQSQITRLYGEQLAEQALVQVPDHDSCRNWGQANLLKSRKVALGAVAVLFTIAIFPDVALSIAMLWAALTLLLTIIIKGSGFLVHITGKSRPPAHTLKDVNARLPCVSVMIPLFHEPEIADALITRLENLTYPKPLLDIVLVLEAADEITRTALQRIQLPSWIKVVVVPDAKGLTTKPRAMNYALDFCRGTIIGVWDAEDAPEPDQIEKVAARFNEAAPNVVCLQGMLDYYNARQNWISRCFTIEYATWWRVVLPGMARLGFVIPLGGTTLFFRRKALEKLGRWDAHNVTEDADLGVRLARYGYVTELIPTVTYEEANCRPWRWVRQRSRWLKGFMITYCVHMRDPKSLMRDLGFKRFMGLQMIFLATFSQFAFAPVLWSFWVTIFGYTHPIQNVLGETAILALIVLFFIAEILTITMGMTAVCAPNRRHLMKWVLTMPLYFTLGTLASYKALYEMIVTPFYWDKTEHGVSKKSKSSSLQK
ncbi:MAG: glycosyltransferase [Ascidiaceihabitans sp.]|nr:glycosyltransferase [Ascidiaceihabitans sp.]